MNAPLLLLAAAALAGQRNPAPTALVPQLARPVSALAAALPQPVLAQVPASQDVWAAVQRIERKPEVAPAALDELYLGVRGAPGLDEPRVAPELPALVAAAARAEDPRPINDALDEAADHVRLSPYSDDTRRLALDAATRGALQRLPTATFPAAERLQSALDEQLTRGEVAAAARRDEAMRGALGGLWKAGVWLALAAWAAPEDWATRSIFSSAFFFTGLYGSFAAFWLLDAWRHADDFALARVPETVKSFRRRGNAAARAKKAAALKKETEAKLWARHRLARLARHGDLDLAIEELLARGDEAVESLLLELTLEEMELAAASGQTETLGRRLAQLGAGRLDGNVELLAQSFRRSGVPDPRGLAEQAGRWARAYLEASGG